MSVAARIANLGKRYTLGETTRRSCWSAWRARLGMAASDSATEFWALRDISFDLPKGEVLGILGHNGAGKSTLLKILAQITAPTTGRILLKGRVASLLEVGTGFHPDLTGRDNVFLNGSILGMATRDVTAKFDEIAAFSGIESFLDTPVKRYSSGMRVRLAFAVAAHLEPEILIIDEVLAVGDASFQQKCMGKIGSVAREGRTVIFVSHNTGVVENLCRRGIVLDHGRMVFDGSQTAAISHYLQLCGAKAVPMEDHSDRSGSGEIRITGIEFRDCDGHKVTTARSGHDLEIRLLFEKHTAREFPRLGVRIFISTQLGVPVFVQSNRLTRTSFGELPDAGVFVCRIRRLPLPENTYNIAFRVTPETRSANILDGLKNATTLQVTGGDFFGGGRVPPSRDGLLLVEGEWYMQHVSGDPAANADTPASASTAV